MNVLKGAVVLYVVFLAGAHALVRARFPESYDPRVVVVLAALPFVPLAILARAWRDVADALRVALGLGKSGRVGESAALGGRVVSREAPLVSPLSRRPCLASEWALSAVGTHYRRGASVSSLLRLKEERAEIPVLLRVDGRDVPLATDDARTLIETVDTPEGTDGPRPAEGDIVLRENARICLAGDPPAVAGVGDPLAGRFLEERYLPPDAPCWVFGTWTGVAGIRVRRIVLGGRGRVLGKLFARTAGTLALGAAVTAAFILAARALFKGA